jgi:hypothetical protein
MFGSGIKRVRPREVSKDASEVIDDAIESRITDATMQRRQQGYRWNG